MNKKDLNYIMKPDDFKKSNKLEWNKNTDYWTQSELRQVVDTRHFLKLKLQDLFAKYPKDFEFTIYDFGFGNCWLLELIIELKVNFKYIGFDFNKKFIEIYTKKYQSLQNIKFIDQDLEEPISQELLNKADFVFTLFTLFEIPQVDKVFKNVSNCLKNKGKHILMTIDSFYLMLALSNNFQELKDILKTFSDYKNKNKTPYFFQDIDLGDKNSTKLKYASVLYTTSDYIKKAQNNNLDLITFDELIKTAKFTPKVYQYYEFSKK